MGTDNDEINDVLRKIWAKLKERRVRNYCDGEPGRDRRACE